MRKRMLAGLLAGMMVLSAGTFPSGNAGKVQAAEETEWEWLKEKLEACGGVWNTPDYTGALNDTMPETALLGNGDTGVVSYGNAAEKTYLISKGDFWNGGDLVTSAPFNADDRSIRQIALGGVTVKQRNRSLTREPGVTVRASSVHDDFVPELAINGILSAEEEAWASKAGETPHWLEIDLGSEKQIAKYVMYHMGAARTDLTHYNAREYTVRVSRDGSSWTEIDHVTGNTSSVTSCVLEEAVSARYVRIDFIQGEQDSNVRGRIAEFELFANASDKSILGGEEDGAHSSGDFEEKQDIVSGDLTTKMTLGGVPLIMDTWLSATENLMITKISSDGSQPVDLDASVWTKADGSSNFPNASGITEDKNAVWASRSTYNAAKNRTDSWTSEAVICAELVGKEEYETKQNGNASASLEFTLNPKETVYLVTAVGGGGQTYNHRDELQTEEPLKEASSLAETYAEADKIAELREAHEAWWKDYWMKSYIDIGDEEYHRYYYGSLYYMGCTARKDTLAPGLYGIWVTGDDAKWNHDFHLNYNYMAPFYGMYSSNRAEGAYSLTQPILDYMPKAEKAAKEQLRDVNAWYVDSRADLAEGIDGGVLYPVGLAPWGQISWEAESSEKYLSQTINAPFAATVFISYFNYTQDEEFLTERAYPFVEKVARFYEQWCEKEYKENGEYQYNLYDAPHEGEEFFAKNSGTTIGAVMNVYEFLIDNFEVLKEKAGATEEQLAVWKDLYEHMAPVPVREYSTGSFQKKVFALAETGMILRPESASVELEFIHPGERLSFDSDPELLEIARNTVEAKEAANWENWSNDNNTPKIYTHAIRAGFDPAYIMEKFRCFNIQDKMKKNFTIHDGNHGIEKAGGIEFINNMLLQSSGGILKVFPNWTGADARFRNLREKGAYLVSAEMSGGDVQWMEVVSETGKDVTIVAPWKNVRVVDQDGNIVKTKAGRTKNTEEATVTFQAKAGETYRLTGDNYDYADTDVLEQVLECVRGLDGTMYTAESYQAVEMALAEAEGLLQDRPMAERQEEIEACIQKLSEAVKGLKALKEEDTAKLNDELEKAKKEALRVQTELEKLKSSPVLCEGDTVEVQGVKYRVTDEAKKQMEAYGVTGRKETELAVADSIQVKGTIYQVTAISSGAFKNCKKLTALTIGKHVKAIGKQAFYRCKKLKSVVFKSTKAPKIGGRAFAGIRKNCKVTVPKKMSKKNLQKLKKGMKGAGKKIIYKKK